LRINRRWINFYKQGQRAIELAMSTFWARCRPDSINASPTNGEVPGKAEEIAVEEMAIALPEA